MMNYDQKQQSQKQKMLHNFAHIFAAFLIMISCLSFAQNARAQDITSGLVGHWTFDNVSGTNVYDEMGSTAGTWSSDDSPASIKTVDGIIGQAAIFDGGDEISLGTGSSTVFDVTAENAFTISAWVKPNGGGNIFGLGSSNSASAFLSYNIFVNVSNRWQSEVSDGANEIGIFTNAGTVNFNSWQYVTLTFDGTTSKLYLNGEFLQQGTNGSFTNIANPAGSHDEVHIGGATNGANFDGQIDEVRFYDRALTDADIVALYSNDGGASNTGYFVMIGNQPTNAEANEFTGNLGGIDGANATCLSYLQNYDWRGKDIAVASEMLKPGNVQAWLCDDDGCQDMLPNTQYAFAKTEAGGEDTGGATFTTDDNGFYPSSDTNAWSNSSYFARDTFFWTGREANNTNTAGTNIDCNNFTATANLGLHGRTNQTGTARWSIGTAGCSTTDQFVCFVNPAIDHKICNSTHAGKMIYNANYRVMQYCDGTEWINMGKDASILHGQKTSGEEYDMNGVEFDGTNDWLTTTGFGIATPLTTISGSFWIYRTASGVGTNQPIIFTEDTPQVAYFRARFNTSNQFVIDGRDNASGTFTTFLNSTNTVVADGWHHVLFSIDVTDNTMQQLYIDDVDVLNSTGNTDPEFGIDIDLVNIGAEAFTGNNRFHGRLADVWVDFGNYIDFSVEENRRKFINPDGLGIDLGTDGSLPFGTAPDIYLSGDTANWHTNKTGGAGFTENGALTDSTVSPTASYERKLVGWWKLDEVSGTTAVDNSGNGNNATLQGAVTYAPNAGVNGGAAEFAGTNGCIYVNPINEEMRLEGTYSYWMKIRSIEDVDTPISAANSTILHFMRTANQFRTYLDDTNGGAPLNMDFSTAANTVIFDEWAHFVLAYDSTSARIYKDGTLITTSPAPAVSTMYGNPSGFWFGCDRNIANRSIDGFMDDIRVYNYALSAAEISELYNASSDFYMPQGIDFDGTNYLDGANMNFGQDQTKLTTSFWIKRDPAELGANRSVWHAYGPENLIMFSAQNRLNIYLNDDAGNRVNMISSVAITDSEWHHILASVDTSSSAKSKIFIDGVEDLSVNFVNFVVDSNFDLDVASFDIGQEPNGTRRTQADIADLWLDFGTYIDLSDADNRLRFTDLYGNAKYLGANGELVTGTSPTVFLSGDTATWHTNDGTGGGFTEVGTLVDAPTSPNGEKLPRYCANPVEGEGTMIFNSDENVMQYCDGNSWIPLGPPGDGGSYCNPPFAYAGSLIFNSTYKTMQYCEGDEWVAIGKDTREDVLAAGLVGHWKLDETSGTVANDSSGNGNHGNYINTPVPATGIVQGALDFQETDRDGVEITGTNFGRPLSFTISGWVDVDSLDTAGGTLLNVLGRGRVEIYPTYIEGSYESAGAVQNRTQYNISLIGTGWRHITYVMDYNENWQRLYLDGSPVANSFFSTPVNWGTSTTSRIGRHISDTSNYDIDGRLDDVKLFNRVLSPSEVQEMYSASLSNLPSSDWKFVSSGRYYTCGIKTDDTGHCWGYNYNGQLGNNSTASIPKPSPISGGHTWSYLSAGATHSCGILTNGDGYCWGDEQDGSLGNGSPDADTLVPVPISGGHKWTVIEAAGADDHTCGIADTQIGYCWGDGYGYTLGESGFTDRHTPNIIPDGYNWVDIDTGYWFGCGVTTEASNNGRCWGAGNNGRLGYGGGNSRNWPNRVSGGHTWLQISNGDYNHGCGIISDGRAKCWGYNVYGQVGDASNTERLGTTFVSGGHTWTQVTTGYYHSCGIRTDGVTMCWGYNGYGNLGDGTTTYSNVPVVVSGGHTFTQISAGGYHTCGIRTDNKMYCWGRGVNGQLGTWKMQNSYTPVEVK